MNQTRKILPVYTSDVSGVCSALYELGGMVVMHDPSGCNSTYNTHDETRWYAQDSLIFISALTERDAILGNDEKFYRDVRETAEMLHPAFIAITNSPIPYLTGTDFPALVKRLQKETGIPSFYVPANGMHDYTMGAGRAYECVARYLVMPAEEHCRSGVNLLGLTPLDYAAAGSASQIRSIFEAAGFEVISSWAMADTAPGGAAEASGAVGGMQETDLLSGIRRAGEAGVNVVVSSTGLRAAKVLYERFGTPYVIGTPTGLFTGALTDAARAAARRPDAWEASQAAVYRQIPQEEAMGSSCTDERCAGPVTLVGEPVIMGSLAAAVRMETGRETQVICPTEVTADLLRTGGVDRPDACPGDRAVHGEEETQAALRDASCIIADPFYRMIAPAEAAFYPLPTLSMSGRSHLKETVNLAKLNRLCR